MPQKKTIQFELSVFKDETELPEQFQQLMAQANVARKKAYAPYSNFQVGAAVLLENGEIILGSNQENASFPSGLCAERVAIFYAGAHFPEEPIKAIAIRASSKNCTISKPTPPCGACRQSIAEYERKQNSPIKIFFKSDGPEIHSVNSIEDLLPLSFDKSFLSDS